MAKSKKDNTEIEGGQIVNVAKVRNYGRKLKLRPYQLVFDPTPKQKWHKQLIALIPPIGHELDCPLEFEQFPIAKYEWLRITARVKTLKPEHRELLYGYCLMVERRKRCMLEWDGDDKYESCTDENGKKSGRVDYLAFEIDRLTTDINKVGKQLGLYPKVKKEKVKDGNEDYEYEESESDDDFSTDDLFD